MKSAFRFPQVRLTAEPTNLRAAVGRLPDGNRSGRPPEHRLRDFRERVRSQPAAVVAASMTLRQHRWLVFLATAGEEDLNERITGVAVALIDRGRTEHLLDLPPWLPVSKGLLAAMAPVAHRSWGTSAIPPWLRQLSSGPKALGVPELQASILLFLRRERAAWPDLVKTSRLPRHSPLANWALKAAVDRSDEDWTRAQDDERVARWTADGSVPRDLALNALVRLLMARIASMSRREQVAGLHTGTLGLLIDALSTRLGAPFWKAPRLWREIPDPIQELARLRRSIQIVLKNFEFRRRQFWIPYLSEATEVEAIQTGAPWGSQSESGWANAVLIKLRGRCFLEFSSTGNACYCYSPEDWGRVRRRSNPPTTSSLKDRSYTRGPHWLTHQGDYWESKFRSYISRLPRDG